MSLKEVRISTETTEDSMGYRPNYTEVGTLSNDENDGSENVAKKMNLHSFEFNRVYLDPLNMTNTGDFSWS